MKKALVLIDYQKGFLSEYTKELPLKVRDFVSKHKSDYDLVVFTQYKNRPDSIFVKNLDWHGFMEAKEYDLFDELKEFVTEDNLFPKYTYGSFVTDELPNVFKEKGIEAVAIAGIDTENCVLTFARDAFDRGYKVTVLKDLCASHSNPKLHKAALEIIANNICDVL